VSALYVIASHGRCVINGLGEVKVFENEGLAQGMLDSMLEDGVNADGYWVQRVHLVKDGVEA
jgi:hypothetical protein